MNPVKQKEFAARRAAAAKALKGAVGVVFAGDAGGHLDEQWRPDPNFYYLTGVLDEPGACLVLDPGHPNPAWRETLLLRPLDPEVEKWDGLREEIGGALRKSTGFGNIRRTGMLGRVVLEAVRRAKRVACLHPLAQHTQPVSPDLSVFQALAERVPGVEIEDKSDLLAGMRMVKSTAEAKNMGLACAASKIGLERLIAEIGPGVSERVLQASLEKGFAEGGGVGTSFAPIVGWGINSCVLHYKTNHNVLGESGIVLVDSGTVVNGYASDITRVFPVSGKFTKREAEIYELVNKARRASIAAVKPGATMRQVDAAARTLINKAGFGDYFFHSIGHHLGLETHDVSLDVPLKPGMVITIEPGVYLQDEHIGVRLEDVVRVTPKGRTNLSKDIPVDREDVEAWMKAVRSGRSSRR